MKPWEKKFVKRYSGFTPLLGPTRWEDFMDTRSSLLGKYSCHQMYLHEMLFSVSVVPWLLMFTVKWNNMFGNFATVKDHQQYQIFQN